jgi:hypothetical protein
MRAHVEVDGTVGMSHVQIAVELKEEWNGRCDIRLCCECSNLVEGILHNHPSV